jgi:hypothetical protein
MGVCKVDQPFNGIDRGSGEGRNTVRHQSSGPKIAPQPSRTSGLSGCPQSTRNRSGINTELQEIR